MRAAAKGDVRLSGAEVAQGAGGIDLDDDLGMLLVEVAEQGRDERQRVDFLGGDANGPGRVASARRGRFGECLGRCFDLLGLAAQLFTGGGERISGLAFLEQLDAERTLQRSDPARDRGLAGPQRPRGGQRAAFAGDREEVAKVVPVQHRRST